MTLAISNSYYPHEPKSFGLRRSKGPEVATPAGGPPVLEVAEEAKHFLADVDRIPYWAFMLGSKKASE